MFLLIFLKWKDHIVLLKQAPGKPEKNSDGNISGWLRNLEAISSILAGFGKG